MFGNWFLVTGWSNEKNIYRVDCFKLTRFFRRVLIRNTVLPSRRQQIIRHFSENAQHLRQMHTYEIRPTLADKFKVAFFQNPLANLVYTYISI